MTPKNKPNLNHILFNGVSNLEFISPKTKKIIDNTNDHVLIVPSLINGYKPIITNTIKNTIPKLLLDPIFTSVCLLLIFFK